MKTKNLYKIPVWLLVSCMIAYLFVWVTISFEFAKFNYNAARLYDENAAAIKQLNKSVDSLKTANSNLEFKYNKYRERTEYIRNILKTEGFLKESRKNPFHRDFDVQKSVREFNETRSLK